MYNELFSIGLFTVYGYGLMIAIGILAAYGLAEVRGRKRGISGDQILTLFLVCILGGFFSAKFLFWILHWKDIFQDPGYLLDTLGDGFVVYGGIIGGILTGFLYCRWNRLPFLQFFDLVMPSVAIAQGFGRIGCFLAGCCYGKETGGILAVTFHTSSFAPNGIPLIPVQIYAALLNFLHAAVLLSFASGKRKDGQTAALYLILYSTGRFFLEYLRGDLERGSIGVFSTSQVLAVGTALAGALFWISLKNSRKMLKK